MRTEASARDRKLLLILCGVMLVLIVGVSFVAPQSAENDPRPTITNTGPMGAKAAYLMLEEMGRNVSGWNHSVAELNDSLSDAEVSRTTLILAAPEFDATEQKELEAQVKAFLERGGRVLATGPSGTLLLPNGEVKDPGMLQGGLCHTTPEGPGPLAAVGSVEMVEGGSGRVMRRGFGWSRGVERMRWWCAMRWGEGRRSGGRRRDRWRMRS